jgi:hypothetical protein
MTGQRVSVVRVVICSISSSVLLGKCVETLSGDRHRRGNVDLRIIVVRAEHIVLKEGLG